MACARNQVLSSEHGSDGLHSEKPHSAHSKIGDGLDGFPIEEYTFEAGRDVHVPRLVEFEEEGMGAGRPLVAAQDEDGCSSEDEGDAVHELKFNRWLMAVQCAVGPLFCVAILFGEFISSLSAFLCVVIGRCD